MRAVAILGPRASYVLGKTARYGVVVFIIISFNFFIPRMMPGSPIQNLLGETASANPAAVKLLEAQYGLDKPIDVQFFDYLKSLSKLDLGYSIVNSMSVSVLISYRLFWTLVLILPSIAIGSMLALIAGPVAGFKSGSKTDILITGISVIIYTAPQFLVAMLAVSVLGFQFGLFPLGEISSGFTTGFAYIIDVCYHLFLPVAILSAFEAAQIFLVVRNSVIQIKEEHFIFVARSRGLSDKAIMFKHVIRNVMPQFISMIALNVGFMVSGALLVEIVFSINGMGLLIYNAVMTRDYPVMQGAFLVLTIFVIISNFVAELLYGIADPRSADRKSLSSSG